MLFFDESSKEECGGRKDAPSGASSELPMRLRKDDPCMGVLQAHNREERPGYTSGFALMIFIPDDERFEVLRVSTMRFPFEAPEIPFQHLKTRSYSGQKTCMARRMVGQGNDNNGAHLYLPFRQVHAAGASSRSRNSLNRFSNPNYARHAKNVNS